MRDDCAIFLMLFVFVCIACGCYWSIVSASSVDQRFNLALTMCIGAIIGYLLGVPNRRRT